MKQQLFGILLTCCIAITARAQWVQTTGPEGGDFALVTTTSTDVLVFSGGPGGLMYRSTDAGQSWTGMSQLYDPLNVGGDTLVNLGGELNYDSLFRFSTDGGLTWTGETLHGITYLDNLTVSGSNFYTVQHDTSSSTYSGWNPNLNYWIIYRSSDRGIDWDSISAIPQGPSEALLGLFSPSCLLSAINGVLFATSTGENDSSYVYRSMSGGQSWSEVFNGTLDGLSTNGTLLMAAGTTGLLSIVSGIYTSSDQGQSWHLQSTGTALDRNATVINVLYWDGSVFLAGTQDSGIFRYDGSSWQEVDSTPGIQDFGMINGLDIAASGVGILRSMDHGRTWSESNHGIEADYVSAIATQGTNVVAQASTGAFYSQDEGSSWQRVNLPKALTEGGLLAADESTVFLGVQNVLFRSTDGGATWKSQPSPQPAGTIDGLAVDGSLMMLSSNIFFTEGVFPVITDSQYVSTNSGQTWQLASQQLNSYPVSIAALSNTLFMWDLDTIFRSTDNGHTWLQNTPPGDLYVDGIIRVGSTLVLTAHSYPTFSIFLSSDDGATWTPAPAQNLPKDRSPRLFGINNALLAIVDSQIWVSSDVGQSFRSFGTGLDPSDIPSTIAFSNNYALAGTFYASVWWRPLSQLRVIQSTGNFGLSIQNAPNPCSNVSTITYSLPVSGFISIELFDALGRSIRSVESAWETIGPHERQLDLHALPNGTYFCRITEDGQTATVPIFKSGE